MTTVLMSRGNSLRIKGLPKLIQTKFRRAVVFAGARSQSEWLATAIRRLIREQENKYGNLLTALTPDEIDIIDAIRDGANDPEHIAAETMIATHKLNVLLDDLVSRDVLAIRRQGGKTDAARGARRPLYFLTEKYQSRSG